MIALNFTEQDKKILLNLELMHPHHFVRRKAKVLLLKSHGFKHKKIAEIDGASEGSLRNYFKEYLKNGISSVESINFYKPTSSLEPFRNIILEHVKLNPFTSIKHACEEIEKLTGIMLKESAMRVYLKSIGVKFLKTCSIPAKADVEEQKRFLKDDLTPRLKEAKKGKREVHFIDAAHFVLGGFSGYLWCIVRVFVRTPSGRQRYNILGALNAITKELLVIANDTYITSRQVCDLLDKIAQNATLPITLVLDNARYQRCKKVMEHAKKLNIESLFLPPYSPNLNLIERVWKFTKKKCLNSKYYSNFDLFKGTISTFLENMHTTHKAELKSLLTSKFQVFTKEQIKQAI